MNAGTQIEQKATAYEGTVDAPDSKLLWELDVFLEPLEVDQTSCSQGLGIQRNGSLGAPPVVPSPGPPSKRVSSRIAEQTLAMLLVLVSTGARYFLCACELGAAWMSRSNSVF